jgi:predicted dehydrogenase
MEKKIRWGVLGVANIAVKKVIPGMQKCALCEIVAIASRDGERAIAAAAQLGIPKAYAGYEALLADQEIDAIYNPLPNHLHVPWSIAAARAGKHVLCEKPIALSVMETLDLIAERDAAGVLIGEAFMTRTHPQWLRAKEIAAGGELGQLKSVLGAFSYFNADPSNIRNVPGWGGGGLMDIGCYPITMSRFLYGREPKRVLALVDRDPQLGTDRRSSALLDFSPGECVFSCSTQLVPFQTIQALGTKARLQIDIPFNAPPDRPTKIHIDTGKDLFGGGSRTEEFEVCDQYALQGDAFARAILKRGPVPVPLEDALNNMAVIEALFRSAESGHWEAPSSQGPTVREGLHN